jgi:hypothetical protein
MPAIVHQMRTLRRIHILACPSSVRYGPSSWGTFIGMAALPAPSRSRFGGTPTWGWLDKTEELRRGAAPFFVDDGTSDAGAQPGEVTRSPDAQQRPCPAKNDHKLPPPTPRNSAIRSPLHRHPHRHAATLEHHHRCKVHLPPPQPRSEPRRLPIEPDSSASLLFLSRGEAADFSIDSWNGKGEPEA